MQSNNPLGIGGFERGKSGNPLGRPPKTNRSLKRALRRVEKENNVSFIDHIAEQAYKDNEVAIEVLKRLIPPAF